MPSKSFPLRGLSLNEDAEKEHLPMKTKLAYSVGHVLNDLVASLWFSYLLLFLTFVLGFSSTMAGGLLLLGQIVDAVSTPLVGILSDKRLNWFVCRYGRKKAWHLLGTVMVAISVPFIFHTCLGCSSYSGWTQFPYYALFIAVMQFGWAAVQVSHVSLITDLTDDSAERVGLNAYRYAATVVSQIAVYVVTWLILGSGNANKHVGPADADSFRNIVLIVMGMGLFFSALFYIFVKEPNNDILEIQPEIFTVEEGVYRKTPNIDTKIVAKTADEKTDDQQQKKDDKQKVVVKERDSYSKQRTLMQWIRRIEFYQVALIYMSSRLYVNLSQVYMTLYLQDTLALPKQALATIPLVTNVSGLLFAFGMKPLTVKAGTKAILLLGCLVGAAASAWVQFGYGDEYDNWQIYIVAGLFGVGGTTMMVSSLAITVDMIGTNTNTGAFVFGAMSFFDKFANGGAVLVVQELNPFRRGDVFVQNPYYRNVLVCGCGTAALFTLGGLIFLSITEKRRTARRTEKQTKS